MKRSTAIDILKTTLTKYNNNTPWYSEREPAEEILNILDQIGLLKPTHKVSVTKRDIEFMPYEETVTVEGWEKE